MSYYWNKTLSYFKKDTENKDKKEKKEEEKNEEDKKEKEEEKKEEENKKEKEEDKKDEPSGAYYYWDKFLGFFRKKSEDNKEEKEATIRSYLKNPLAVFKALDRNGDGKITEEDFVLAIHNLGLGSIGDYVMRQAFRRLDTNRNGVLDFLEALSALSLVKSLVGTVAGATALSI